MRHKDLTYKAVTAVWERDEKKTRVIVNTEVFTALLIHKRAFEFNVLPFKIRTFKLGWTLNSNLKRQNVELENPLISKKGWFISSILEYNSLIL